jgi:hypothetical protein
MGLLDDAIIFDVEGDGLEAEKLHCLVQATLDGKEICYTDYQQMRDFLSSAKVLVGHNIICWDIPTLERVLGIKIEAELIDTLPLSWALFPDRVRHGLEYWGVDFGVPKPAIADWQYLTSKEYAHRCTEDVKINKLLWKKQLDFLRDLYDNDKQVLRYIRYLSFKMQCVRLQEDSKWRLDFKSGVKLLEGLSKEFEDKTEALAAVMPKVPKRRIKKRPAKLFKKNGALSKAGEEWEIFCKEHSLDKTTTEEYEYVHHFEEPKPTSHQQIKNWLFSLGWKPCTYKYNRNKETGDVKKVPQVADKGDLTPSVKALLDKEPDLVHLDSYGIVSHRIGVVRGLLESMDKEGFVKARVQGLTNTLRFQHAECVNIPAVDKPYGKEIRGLFMARDGYELCGSDQSSLEDRTKQHYMWPFDPDYVEEMMTDGFDPHLDICIAGGILTPSQCEAHKSGVEDFSQQRKLGKAANYACVYGASGATVARSAGISEPEGNRLVEAYWRRNWSVKAIAENCKTKVVKGSKWLYNPVSGFWYSLRHDKDRFSTLNQGTGVYCFDLWIKFILEERKQLTAQFHDEIILEVRKGFRQECEALLKRSEEKVNKTLKLNRELDISVDFGDSYDKIH